MANTDNITLTGRFNVKPRPNGMSTAEIHNIYGLRSEDLAEYNTVIGSTSYDKYDEYDSGNDAPALLIHAADIFWGDAKLSYLASDNLDFDGSFGNKLFFPNKTGDREGEKSYHIRTSQDIIAVLEYLLEHISAPELTITPSPEKRITASEVVTATIANSSGVVEWILTENEGTSGQTFRKDVDVNNGNRVTITPNDDSQPASNNGTISVNIDNSSSGKAIITGEFNRGETSYNEYATTVTAKYNGINKSVRLIFSKSTPSKTEGTWTISYNDGSTLPRNLEINQDLPFSFTGNFDNTRFKVTNTSYDSNITLPANTFKFTNSSAENNIYNASISIKHKAKSNPTLTINDHANKIADGESIEIIITSNTTGNLSLDTYNVNGWEAECTSTGEKTHKIRITNLSTVSSAGSIPTNDIKATFTPNGTNAKAYNTLTNQNVLKQAITLSAVVINYYWYVGYNQDAFVNPESFKANMYTTNTNAIPTQYSKSGDNGLDVSVTGTRPNYLIMIIPSTWSTPKIYGQLKDAEITMTLEKQNVTITGISNETFNVYSGTGEISDSKVFINLN